MSLSAMIKKSCGGADNTSSKRIIMYIFTLVLIFMIKVQALFTLILIWKWSNGAVDKFEMVNVFPDTIWYMVTGLIAGLAGINGIKDGFGKQAKTPVTNNEEIN